MLPSRWWSAEWQSADLKGHYSSHPCPRVADRETPSRMDKKVAPDKEGVVDKQCLEKGNSDSKPEQMALQVSLSGRKNSTTKNMDDVHQRKTLQQAVELASDRAA